MSALRFQEGLSLIGTMIVLLVITLPVLALQHHSRDMARTHSQQSTASAKALKDIRESLLMFASQQGYNSHTQPGHLPCPALTAGGPPEVACLKNPAGYLPIQSIAKINYLNPGLANLWNPADTDSNKHWQYVVSPQVIQPNTMKWSRWVNFNEPSLTIDTPKGTTTHVVAAVAAELKAVPNQSYRYQATEPLMVLTVSDLQKTIKQAQRASLQNTLNQWNGPHNSNENLIQLGSPSNQGLSWKPVTSKCQCECTKTQCKCQCNQAGQWSSANSCSTSKPPAVCKAPTHAQSPYTCSSTADTPCIFEGPTQLSSGWPISSFDPVARSNNSCHPTSPFVCPLSPTSDPSCFCTFSWPNNTENSLNQFNITSTSSEPFVFSVAP